MKIKTVVPIPLNSYTIFCHIFTLANHETTECPMMDTRLPHNDINLGIGNELYPSNWEECGKLCNASPLCKFWTYYVPTGGCWLKDANSGATIGNGNISGNKNCPLPTGAGIKFHILINNSFMGSKPPKYLVILFLANFLLIFL